LKNALLPLQIFLYTGEILPFIDSKDNLWLTTIRETSHSAGNKIQFVLAVIAVLGTIGTAIIGNWDKIFSKPAASPAPQSIAPTSNGITSSSPAPSQTTGVIEVEANAGGGFPFSNPLDKPVKIRFQADGYWSANPRWKDRENGTSPEGYDGLTFAGDILCNAPASSLVVKNSRGDCQYMGKDKTIYMALKETIYFYINDIRGFYDDNKGSVKVKWSIENQ
jgi:hypothetical protein